MCSPVVKHVVRVSAYAVVRSAPIPPRPPATSTETGQTIRPSSTVRRGLAPVTSGSRTALSREMGS
jgi:hypothetical protein